MTGNSVAGNKISLGVYSAQTDWEKQEIEVIINPVGFLSVFSETELVCLFVSPGTLFKEQL